VGVFVHKHGLNLGNTLQSSKEELAVGVRTNIRFGVKDRGSATNLNGENTVGGETLDNRGNDVGVVVEVFGNLGGDFRLNGINNDNIKRGRGRLGRIGSVTADKPFLGLMFEEKTKVSIQQVKRKNNPAAISIPYHPQ
jgi:hypothetical protein